MKVLITGTTQGIGQAIALHFLQQGHQVVGIDRRKRALSMHSIPMWCAMCGIGNICHRWMMWIF